VLEPKGLKLGVGDVMLGACVSGLQAEEEVNQPHLYGEYRLLYHLSAPLNLQWPPIILPTLFTGSLCLAYLLPGKLIHQLPYNEPINF